MVDVRYDVFWEGSSWYWRSSTMGDDAVDEKKSIFCLVECIGKKAAF